MGSGISSIYKLDGFTEVDDPANDLNPATGYFVAPETGLYRISMTTSSKFTNPNIDLSTLRNVVFGFVDNATNNWVLRFSVPSSYIKGDFGLVNNNIGLANTFVGVAQLTGGKTYY